MFFITKSYEPRKKIRFVNCDDSYEKCSPQQLHGLRLANWGGVHMSAQIARGLSLLTNAASTVVLVFGSLAGTVACSKAPHSAPIASGQTGTGIIGGTDATGNEDFSKTIVALYNITQGSLCTASIISEQFLVTAAHCVDAPASGLRVVFGTDIQKPGAIQEVVSYQTSPLWATRSNEDLNAGDIAVVRFAGGLPAGYRPAQILANESALQTGTTVMLAGYGISDGVKDTGAGTLRFVETTIANPNFSESEMLIEQRHGKGACHGDSGGPAYVKVNGQWMLWGVTNRGVNDPNNDCSVSAAYAKIPYYQGWVAQTAKKLMKKTSSSPFKPLLASGN